LPTKRDLLDAGILLLVPRLPYHDPCPTGQWQLQIHVTSVDPPAEHERVTFEFVQHGGIGQSLK
jgi:hypothetical protein